MTPARLFPVDADIAVVGRCHRCGDVVYQGHPHKRHHVCADCGEPCEYYGVLGTTNGSDYTCNDCTDMGRPWEGGGA